MRFNIVLTAAFTLSGLAPGVLAGGSLALRGIGETLGMAAVDIILGEPVFNDRRRGNYHPKNYGNNGNTNNTAGADLTVGVLAMQYLNAIDTCGIASASSGTTKLGIVAGEKNKIKLSGLPAACVGAHALWNKLPGLAELNAMFGTVEVKSEDEIEVTLTPGMVGWLEKYTSFYKKY